jgi:hypothetical protein
LAADIKVLMALSELVYCHNYLLTVTTADTGEENGKEWATLWSLLFADDNPVNMALPGLVLHLLAVHLV